MHLRLIALPELAVRGGEGGGVLALQRQARLRLARALAGRDPAVRPGSRAPRRDALFVLPKPYSRRSHRLCFHSDAALHLAQLALELLLVLARRGELLLARQQRLALLR